MPATPQPKAAIARRGRVAPGISAPLLSALILAAGLAWTADAGAQQPPTLPGGASSLAETYGDWRVACRIAGTARSCSMMQQQVRQDGQRVVTIELQTAPGNALAGSLVLPFGLDLAAGATLRIDEQPAGAPLPFRTCLPSGCEARVGFDAKTITALRAGTKLQITTKTADSAQDFAIAISLNGFTAAADRLKAISGQ